MWGNENGTWARSPVFWCPIGVQSATVVSSFTVDTTMSDETQTITKATLKALARTIGKGDREVRDPAFPGLSVRVRARDAAWTLRGRFVGKQSTWRIGSITDPQLADPAAARARAAEAKGMLARGLDPSEWLRAEENRGEMVRSGDPERDGLLWPEAVQQFLAAKAAYRSPHTITDYRYALNAPGLRGKWDERPIRSIRPAEVKGVVRAIRSAGKPAQAQHVLRVIKSLFSWAAQEDVLGEDEAVSPVALVKVQKHRNATGYVPTVDEMGRLFWNLDATPMLPGTRFAVALAALTAQRRETVASALVAELRDMPGRPGWGLWQMEPDPLIESDRIHAVPLPPMTWRIVQVARMCAGGGEFLFPQTRLRSSRDAGGGHVSMKAMHEALQAAMGKHISLHDMRRALSTHGPDVLAIRDADVKLVINHAAGRQDVNGRHYALHESMPWKTGVMERWEAWLVGLIRAAAPRPGAWPRFLPAVETAAAPPRLLAAG